ncbi:MAG TPA: transposase [Arenimonas sp.]|nr:transposase [Arenimonas sp.]
MQRGVDRMVCFARPWDYQRYLDELRTSAELTGCEVHAYVLMSNHVHLLVTPPETGATSRMMQRLGRRYVGYFNTCHVRTGPLWEGRFRSCPVQTDGYLLRCQRYIELNPVRAGMVATPLAYRWSSHSHFASGEANPLLTAHPTYLALAPDAARRREVYAALVGGDTHRTELEELRVHLRQGRPWGNARFRHQIENLLGRRAATRPPGRPSQTE